VPRRIRLSGAVLRSFALRSSMQSLLYNSLSRALFQNSLVLSRKPNPFFFLVLLLLFPGRQASKQA
jgi:hypothetical protein